MPTNHHQLLIERIRRSLVAGLMLLNMPAAYAATPWLGYDYNIHASSTLAEGNKSYPAANLIPPSLSRAWCEGVDGDGKGEWLELKLKQPVNGELQFSILPGYAKSERLYRYNGRPKEVTLVIDGGSPHDVVIQDIAREQSFRINAPDTGTVSTIRMIIRSVYPGEKYQDTCITELLISPAQQPPYDAHQADAEAQRVSSLLGRRESDNLDTIEELVRLADGAYMRSAEGSEWLNEIYTDLFMANPYRFLFVTQKQNDSVKSKALDAIISPVTDKYTFAQLLDGLSSAVKQGIDPDSVETLRTILSEHKRASGE